MKLSIYSAIILTANKTFMFKYSLDSGPFSFRNNSLYDSYHTRRSGYDMYPFLKVNHTNLL
jgi:hypothetical protein